MVDSKIYILGGEDGWEHFHDTIESYSPTEDKWTPIGEMLTGRSWLSCAPLRVCLTKQSKGKIVKTKRWHVEHANRKGQIQLWYDSEIRMKCQNNILFILIHIRYTVMFMFRQKYSVMIAHPTSDQVILGHRPSDDWCHILLILLKLFSFVSNVEDFPFLFSCR